MRHTASEPEMAEAVWMEKVLLNILWDTLIDVTMEVYNHIGELT